MKNSKQIFGKKVSKPPKIRHVYDIEYFDGPLLSAYADKDNNLWLVSWCDTRRHKVWKSSPAEIKKYLSKKIDYLSLIPQNLYLVDDFGYTASIWYKVKLSELPKSYLPNKDCFYDETLDPEDY